MLLIQYFFMVQGRNTKLLVTASHWLLFRPFFDFESSGLVWLGISDSADAYSAAAVNLWYATKGLGWCVGYPQGRSHQNKKAKSKFVGGEGSSVVSVLDYQRSGNNGNHNNTYVVRTNKNK